MGIVLRSARSRRGRAAALCLTPRRAFAILLSDSPTHHTVMVSLRAIRVERCLPLLGGQPPYQRGSFREIAHVRVPTTRVLRRPEVQRRTGLGRTAIYVLMAEGKFPAPIRLTAKAVGWLEAEVAEWIAARVAERDARKQATPTWSGRWIKLEPGSNLLRSDEESDR